MELFFNHNAGKNRGDLEFDVFESSHIFKSKRKKLGDRIFFTDGLGNLYQGEIKTVKPVVTTDCNLIEKFDYPATKLILAIGFIRQNRLDFLIEKATEIGVNKFVLFSGEHSNYFTDNIDRFEKITRQAIKQSLRFYLPEIETESKFDTVLKNYQNADIKIVAEKGTNTRLTKFQNVIQKDSTEEIIFIVGPEGGLSRDEIKSAEEYGYSLVNLGYHRLRAETAALVLSSFFSVNMIK